MQGPGALQCSGLHSATRGMDTKVSTQSQRSKIDYINSGKPHGGKFLKSEKKSLRGSSLKAEINRFGRDQLESGKSSIDKLGG